MNNNSFEYILSAADLGFWELDLATYKVTRTQKHDQIFGYSSLLSDWSYEKFLSYVLPADRHIITDNFEAIKTGGAPQKHEFRIVRHDGEIRWLWAISMPFKDGANKITTVVGLIRDVTEELKTRHALEKIDAVFKQFSEHVDLAFYEISADSKTLTFLSHAIERITEKSTQYFSENISNWLDLIVPEDRHRVEQYYLNQFNPNMQQAPIEYKICRGDGAIRNILDRSFKARNEQNEIVGILGIVSDLSELYLNKRMDAIASHITTIFSTEISLNVITQEILKIFCNNLQWDLGEVWFLDESKKNLYKFCSYVPSSNMSEQQNSQDFMLIEKDSLLAEIIEKEGAKFINDKAKLWHPNYSSLIAARLFNNNECIGIINFFSTNQVVCPQAIIDLLWRIANQYIVHAQKQFAKDQVYLMSNYDVVTGLANREVMVKSLNELINSDSVKTLVVIKLMIDQIDNINQSLGVDVETTLLKEFTARINNEPHVKLHLICHIGNNSFAFILKNINSLQEANDYSQHLLSISRDPFIVAQQKIFLTVSIGVSIFPQYAKDVQSLLSEAKIAMLKAHKSGGNNIVYGTSALQDEIFQQVNVEFALHRAIENSEFVLYYQPKVDLKTGNIVGAEALIRWQEPNGQLRMPGYFLPIAESSDLIIAIGEWVLRAACRQIATDSFAVPIAINLSIRQFRSSGYFFEFVNKTLAEYAIDPAMLEFEITESIIMEGNDIIEDFKRFKEMGIKIAFDDFGTKYCSLTYLNKYTPDKIKIDKSFVDKVPSSATNVAIVKSIVALAKSLQISLTVEGAEHAEQVKFFIDLGCEELQSYYISKALPVSDFKKLLNQNFKELFVNLN